MSLSCLIKNADNINVDDDEDDNGGDGGNDDDESVLMTHRENTSLTIPAI